MSKQTAEVLRKVLEAFGPNGEHWVKGAGDSPKCCIVNSLDRVAPNLFGEPYDVLCRLSGSRDGYLSVWNDAPERTFADVKALLEKAIAEQEAE